MCRDVICNGVYNIYVHVYQLVELAAKILILNLVIEG